MNNIVIISGHPNLNASYTNRLILDSAQTQLSNVSIRKLDTLYPDYRIDIEAEQAALISADVIVLQFPFYWYSVPALLKKWIDDVFAYNFAYGAEGDKLKGKHLLLSFTVGGAEEAYTPLSYNHFPIAELIKPLQQTAYLAGLNFLPHLCSHKMVYIPGVYNTREDVEARAREHGTRLVNTLTSLTESAENNIKQFVNQWFEAFDALPDNPKYFIKSLAESVQWSMPQGEYSGHSGFLSWYAEALQLFKPHCQHKVEQIEITPNADMYKVDLRIRLIAETYPESALKGEPINQLVNETWQVTLDDDKNVCIHSYQVTEV